MSSAVESQTHLTGKATPKNIDYSDLYEQIGNIVIEKAHSGDPVFERIYESAWKKASSKQKVVADCRWQSAKPATSGVGDDTKWNTVTQ